MFSDEILEKIYGSKEANKIPFGFLSDAIRIVSNAIEEVERDKEKNHMLMNFSPENIPIPEHYMSQDETNILILCDKLDNDFEKYGGSENATISKS